MRRCRLPFATGPTPAPNVGAHTRRPRATSSACAVAASASNGRATPPAPRHRRRPSPSSQAPSRPLRTPLQPRLPAPAPRYDPRARPGRSPGRAGLGGAPVPRRRPPTTAAKRVPPRGCLRHASSSATCARPLLAPAPPPPAAHRPPVSSASPCAREGASGPSERAGWGVGARNRAAARRGRGGRRGRRMAAGGGEGAAGGQIRAWPRPIAPGEQSRRRKPEGRGAGGRNGRLGVDHEFSRRGHLRRVWGDIERTRIVCSFLLRGWCAVWVGRWGHGVPSGFLGRLKSCGARSCRPARVVPRSEWGEETCAETSQGGRVGWKSSMLGQARGRVGIRWKAGER